MPVPKRKRSRARRDKRFANKGVKVKVFASCKQCQEPLCPHQACKNCGHYKGVKVARTKSERTEQRTTVRTEIVKKRAARYAGQDKPTDANDQE